MGNRPVQYSSTCQSGSQLRVLSIWGLGSVLVSQVPYLGDTIGVVGIKKYLTQVLLIQLVTTQNWHKFGMKYGPILDTMTGKRTMFGILV